MSDRQLSSDPLPPFTATDYIADRRQRPWLCLVTYISICCLLAFPLLTWAERNWAVVVVYLLLGAVFSPFALLPAWLIWGDRPWPQRLAMAVIFAVYFHLLWWTSLVLADVQNMRFALTVLLLLPAIGLAIAAPLALVRHVFGWRIATSHCPTPRPLGIRHLLIVTALVACSLGMVRIAMRVAAENADEFWIGSAITAGTSAMISLTMIIPLVWLTLGIRNVIIGAVSIGILASGAATVLLVVGSILEGTPPVYIAFGVYLFSISFAYTSAAAFWLARAAGYRLKIGRARQDTIDDAEPL